MKAQGSTSRSLGEVIDGNKDEEGKPIVFTKEQLKKHYDKALACKQRMHDANADWKSALDAAEKSGIPKDAFKDVIKIKTKPRSDERKAHVNIMLEMLGDQPEFNFEGEDATKH